MDSSSSTHRSTTTTTSSSSNSGEVFICFNSRRRLTTKISARPSILSPARDPQIFLSTCRSSRRRLQTSGSATRNRGRSPPMFPGAAKKRGSGFDNPEPSSPKVTCIGQVRVKSKKKGIKLRTLPRRQSGEVSFRTLDHIQRQSSYNNTQFQHSRNQKWVHLPYICESLNCLIPCRPLCVCENDKGEKKQGINEVVENLEEEEEMEMLPVRSTRRHVFDGIEINDEVFQVKDDDDNEEEEENVNVPPKNALLLMRFRSDPVKMEALVSRCWEPQLPKQVEEEENEEVKVEENDRNNDVHVEKVEVKDEVEMVKVCEKEEKITEDLESNEVVQYMEQENQEEETSDNKRLVVEDEEENVVNLVNLFEDIINEESEEDDDEIDPMKDKNEDESRVSYSNASFSLQSDDDISPDDQEGELAALGSDTVDLTEKMTQFKILDFHVVEKMTHEGNIQENKDQENEDTTEELDTEAIVERESVLKKESSKLPDCLLLMMCEPKLSMEVSKETWVCNKDYIYQSPEKKKTAVEIKPLDAGDEETAEDKVAVECKAVIPLPSVTQHLPAARSSRTFPATAASMAAMIEQKLLSAAAYEPFVLTRCKSAPIRTAAIQLAPDGWFWKNGGIESHRRGGFQIGATEFVGFQLSR